MALGVAIAWSPLLANALVPFLVFVNTLPKVAIAPLFLIWMGYGIFPNMLMGALIGFFPVVINTAVGLSQVEADMLDLGRVFNAPKWKIFVKIRIPNALPYILSALKITATAAVVGAIVGEFVASQRGLGYVIVTTQSSMNTSVAFAALIWISVVGLVLYGAVVAGGAAVGAMGRGHRLGLNGEGKREQRMNTHRSHSRWRPGSRRRPAPRRRRSSRSRSTGSPSATMPPTGWRSTRATTRPRASTSPWRTPRAPAIRSPRSTPAAPMRAWPTPPW